MHYPPETCSITLVLRILAYIKQCEQKYDLLMQLRDFCFDVMNEETGIFHKILGDNFQQQIDTLHKLTIAAFPGEDFGNVSFGLAFSLNFQDFSSNFPFFSIYHRRAFGVSSP